MHNGIIDKNRRELSLLDPRIDQVLPSHFQERYPKLTLLFQYYYEWSNEELEATELLMHMFESRDITSVDERLLVFIEDELLLGQSYFEGFRDKRAAAKFSNILYRSKGTKYSIQQFFRTFFGIDPEIIYGKESVFTLNNSKLGGDDFKFLTDDKLYQNYALLIRSGVPVSRWIDMYKLFVHPAGFYIAGQVQIIGEAFLGNSIQISQGQTLIPPAGMLEMPYAGIRDPIVPVLEGIASLSMTSQVGTISYAVWEAQFTDLGASIKLDIDRASLKRFETNSLELLDRYYPTLIKLVDGFVVGEGLPGYAGTGSPASFDPDWNPIFPTFDMDSTDVGEVVGGGTLRFDLDSDATGVTPFSTLAQFDAP